MCVSLVYGFPAALKVRPNRKKTNDKCNFVVDTPTPTRMTSTTLFVSSNKKMTETRKTKITSYVSCENACFECGWWPSRVWTEHISANQSISNLRHYCSMCIAICYHFGFAHAGSGAPPQAQHNYFLPLKTHCIDHLVDNALTWRIWCWMVREKEKKSMPNEEPKENR